MDTGSASRGNDQGSCAPSLSGQGLNRMCRDADAQNRLLNLVPTPTWETVRSPQSDEKVKKWTAGYALAPATEVWASRVRAAGVSRSSRVVGVVGATSAGKSWLIGKLQDEEGPRPSRLEEVFEDITLQSMTSDINLYADPDNRVYYMDFDGTWGTQPLMCQESEHSEVMGRCPDVRAWEAKRRQALKEFYQPAVAYLTCNVVIFMTREKLVCRRALEECEQFATAANGRVVSALPPALILVQNCCRPTEGLFDHAKCTEAFLKTHLGSDFSNWQRFFRSVDCFCVPDEFLTCKRTQFDGESVCKEVIEDMKRTMRSRLEESLAFRAKHHVNLSQLQWYSVLSALCMIVNDREKVQMQSLYIRASVENDSLGEIKAALMQLMNNRLKGEVSGKSTLQTAFGMIARFVVRRELSNESLRQITRYLLTLFPCGAVASNEVQRFDGGLEPVECGQMRLGHTDLHRSSVLVRTSNADWLQGLGEWLQGGITHAWCGEFSCCPEFEDFDNFEVVDEALLQEINTYKLEKCLEGLAPEVGAPWVLRAHTSLRRSGLHIRLDTSQMCVVCTAKGVDPGFFAKMWLPSEGSHLPVCRHCHGILKKHSLTIPDAESTVDPWDQRCEVCVGHPTSTDRPADHRMLPCKCVVCSNCAQEATEDAYHCCPKCGNSLRWMVDERALMHSRWPAAVRREVVQHKNGNMCVCVNRRG